MYVTVIEVYMLLYVYVCVCGVVCVYANHAVVSVHMWQKGASILSWTQANFTSYFFLCYIALHIVISPNYGELVATWSTSVSSDFLLHACPTIPGMNVTLGACIR